MWVWPSDLNSLCLRSTTHRYVGHSLPSLVAGVSSEEWSVSGTWQRVWRMWSTPETTVVPHFGTSLATFALCSSAACSEGRLQMLATGGDGCAWGCRPPWCPGDLSFHDHGAASFCGGPGDWFSQSWGCQPWRCPSDPNFQVHGPASL